MCKALGFIPNTIKQTSKQVNNIGISNWATVAHTWNPSYSGGRNQEIFAFRSQLRQIVRETLSQKSLHNKGLVEWLEM
jgi:hypothetical protein